MSKFGCTCGNVISDGEFPNEVTGWLLSDKSGEAFFDSMTETIDDYLRHAACGDVAGWRRKHFNEIYPEELSAGNMIHDAILARFVNLTLAAMECDKCGHLWFQSKPCENKYSGFKPDVAAEERLKVLGFNSASPEA